MLSGGWWIGVARLCLYVCGLLQDGRTALLIASEKGHEACVNLLLDKGAQVDLLNKVRCGCGMVQ